MDKLKAKEIINSCSNDEDELYDAINYIKTPSNNFNQNDYFELLFKNMYLYHKLHGIENISSRYKPQLIIDRNISYEEFKIQLEKYKNYDLKIDGLPEVNNYYDNILRLSASKIIDMSDWAWTRIYSSTLTGKELEIIGKMYISIDNKDLYKFANLLFSNCIETGLSDYEFKVNNNDSKTRYDNVVIFFTSKNFEQYVSLINQIFSENPEITINSHHPFGYAINDTITVGKDNEKDNQSFTEMICSMIVALKNEKLDTDTIIEYIDNNIQNHMIDIIHLNDDVQQNRVLNSH